MEEYNDLKKDTFLYLLSGSEESISLITASLIIAFYFDKCIYKNNTKLKPLVSKAFLKECVGLLTFHNDDGKIAALDSIQKINLIRSKLAHGDYVVAPHGNSIIFKTNIDEKEFSAEVAICDIVLLAKHMANYSRYPKSSEKRETICYKDGLQYLLIDKPNKSFERNSKYEKRFNLVVNTFFVPHDGMKHDIILNSRCGPNRLSFNMFDIVYHITETNKNNGINEYPNRKDIEWGLLQKLDNPNSCNYLCSELIEGLIEFYKYYIYPLENFLKNEDKNTMSLLNDEMFGFEMLNIDDAIIKDVPYVGKVDNYFDSRVLMYDKIKNLYDEFAEIEKDDNNPYYDNAEKKKKIEGKLAPYIDVVSNPSVMKLYSYGKKRSFIEHIRCSIEHGNYDYDLNNDKITFIDSWQDNDFNFVTSVNEFNTLFNHDNKKLIMEQFETVYNFKNYSKSR